MNKTIILILALTSQILTGQKSLQMIESIHQFKVTDLYGETFDLSSLKGKKVMIVNTASKCGLTYQYELLESLFKNIKPTILLLLDFRQIIFFGKNLDQMNK